MEGLNKSPPPFSYPAEICQMYPSSDGENKDTLLEEVTTGNTGDEVIHVWSSKNEQVQNHTVPPIAHQYYPKHLRPQTGKTRQNNNDNNEHGNTEEIATHNDTVAPLEHTYHPRKLRPLTGRTRSKQQDEWLPSVLPQIDVQTGDTKKINESVDVPVNHPTYKKVICAMVIGISIVVIIVVLAIVLVILLKNTGALSDQSGHSSSPNPGIPGPTVGLPVGVWGIWSGYSNCSLTCGGGFQTRVRLCSALCLGPSAQLNQCNQNVCPITYFYGTWSTWTSWSACTNMCGSGSQSRTRVCQKATASMIECVGNENQTRICNNHPCPDCSMTCAVGNISINCTHCICSENVNGQVMSSAGFPLKDVQISPSNAPYSIFTQTSISGTFTLTGQCNESNVLFSHSNYVSFVVKISSILSDTGTFVMEKVEALTVVRNPTDRVAITGQSITLCCETTGKPEANNYEWLKDGNLISTTTGGSSSSIILNQVTENSTGHYSCRANNDYSAVTSKTAYVNVKGSSSSFCFATPKSRTLELPEGCSFNGSTTVDKGECVSSICMKGNNTNTCSRDNYCCGPLTFDAINVDCELNVKLTVMLVTSCGCILCPTPQISLSGVAVGSNGTFLRNGSIIRNGTEIGQTSEYGTFDIVLPVGTERVVLLFKDTTYNQLLDTIYVVDIPKDSEGVNYITVKMLAVSEQLNLSSSINNTISLKGNSNGPVIAEIDIPAGAFYTENGLQYNGSVRATIGVIDPSDISALELAPGDFTAIDDEGIEQPLQSYGMFSFGFKTENGQRLSIPDDITVEIPTGQLGKEEGTTAVKFWRLNPNTGRWQIESDITVKADRKKHHSGSTATLHGIPYTSQWFNFDAIRNSACYSKVRVFKNRDYNANEEVEGVRISVIIQGDSNSLSRFRAYTDNGDSNGYCVLHPCQSTRDTSNRQYNYKGYIFAERSGKPLIPAAGYQTGLNGNLPTTLQYTPDTQKISVGKVQLSLTPSGPYYDYTGGGWKGWAESTTCSNAPITDSHFRFSADTCYKSFDTVDYDQVARTTCNDNYFLLWYSLLSYELTSHLFQSTFIKVYLPDVYGAKLRAYSTVRFKRTNSFNIGDVGSSFGYREDCLEEDVSVVCLEVKGPSKIGCSLLHTEEETETGIKVMMLQGYGTFSISQVNANLISVYGSDVEPGIGTGEFNMILRKHPYGPDYGIYSYEHKNKEIARQTARKNCLSGIHQAGSSNGAVTTTGWAFKVDGACSNKMDLVFILDTSGSMWSYTNQVRTFIKGVMSRFSSGISNSDVRFALVTFKPSGAIKWNLDDPATSSLSQMSAKLDEVTLSGNYKPPHIALNLARTSVFGGSGDRSDAKNVVIYISDGNERQDMLDIEVPELQKLARVWAAATPNVITEHIDLFETYPGDDFSLSDTNAVASAVKNYLC